MEQKKPTGPFHIGQVVFGTVRAIQPTYIKVAVGDYIGILHVSLVSDYFITNLPRFFKHGESGLWLVTEIDDEEKILRLSYKALNPRFQKDPFSFVLEPTPSDFKNLKKLQEEGENNA